MLRVAPFHLVEKIVGFPYGDKICDKHRKQLYTQDTATVDDFNINYWDNDDDMETNSSIQSFATSDKSQYHQAQQILAALDQSPIKSQSKIPLNKQIPGAVRRQTAKLRKAVAAATTTLANSIALGQANTLVNLAGLDNVVTTRSSSTQSTIEVDENFLAYLVQMYRTYEEKNFPYNEKIRLLALIPDHWNLSYDDIINHFGCTWHAVKTARSLKIVSSTPLHVNKRPSITRQRYNPAQIDHFLTWLIETKLLVSVFWDNTHLQLENGNTLTIPRQVLQAKRSHVIHQYISHCSEVNFKPLKCLDVVQLFDDIERHVVQVQHEEEREDLKYDFSLARENIFEMFRHPIRTVQQDTTKSRVLASMSKTTAFQTIDWAQKILPQGFREGQTAYYGKKGMSALAGSFTFYDTTGENHSSQICYTIIFLYALEKLITRTYILCLTRCDQTEQATLSGGYLILKQFHNDYPHITSLIKRSDNASILAGNATPVGEWSLANLVGLKLLVRDYSEIQSGKDICDRIFGAAKMRMKAFLHAGHDVINSFQIKLGMEYCGGINHVKIGTAEMIDSAPLINK
ncbi:unnamed protein product [Rotaria sordida]|uniref:Uncharacterized protein n=1 Tax=Rotaria sordida TaxID=392033 RepID=A0A815XL63_9BILA|nr:unnamed protein product [Rotaria sordida]CAF1558912.1 unnamed protein product [Rotaria sordida]